MRRALANACLVLAAASVLVACGGGGDDEATPPDRPPLDSPPDPGPVPETDGLTDARRDEIAASTVRIDGIACGSTSEGSGFAVTEELIVTNAHVVLGLERPTVETLDGAVLEGRVVAFDAVLDLAVIRLEGADFTPLPLGTAPDGTIGAVFGWERGPVVDPTPFRVDRPVTVRIEAVGRDDRIERPSWLLAAEIEAGDSGAAVVDEDGVVVGVAYATTTRGSSVAYAVRAEALEELLAAGFNDNLIVPDC